MTTIHNLGFPRIGARRELKFALESYWKGASTRHELQALGAQLRQRHWENQAGLDLVPVGDFAFYDQVPPSNARNTSPKPAPTSCSSKPSPGRMKCVPCPGGWPHPSS